MNELSSGPRVANTATQSGAVHVIVDGKHANTPALVKSLAALRSRLSRRLYVQPSNRHIHALAREAAVARAERVIVVGDDGAVNQAVCGLMSVELARRPPLAIVPIGEPTEIARSAGMGSNFDAGRPRLDGALFEASIGIPAPVDVGRWGSRWFLNLACGGALSDAPLGAAGLSEIMGGLAYAVAGVMGLPAMRPVELAVRGESFTWSGSAYVLAIGNTRTIGGGFGLCPDASIADGELDVTIIPASLDLTDVLELIDDRGVAGVPAISRFRSPWVELRAGARVHLDVDGELRSCSRARFDLTRAALEFVLPPCSPLLDAPGSLPSRPC